MGIKNGLFKHLVSKEVSKLVCRGGGGGGGLL